MKKKNIYIEYFFHFTTMTQPNAQLQQSQIYLEIKNESDLNVLDLDVNWTVSVPYSTLSRFNAFEIKHKSSKELLIYSMLFETYNYLTKFFISHQLLLNNTKTLLIRNKTIFRKHIEKLIIE